MANSKNLDRTGQVGLERDDVDQEVWLGLDLPLIHAASGPPSNEPNPRSTAYFHLHVGGAPVTSVEKASTSLSPCSRRRRLTTRHQDQRKPHHTVKTQTDRVRRRTTEKVEHLSRELDTCCALTLMCAVLHIGMERLSVLYLDARAAPHRHEDHAHRWSARTWLFSAACLPSTGKKTRDVTAAGARQHGLPLIGHSSACNDQPRL